MFATGNGQQKYEGGEPRHLAARANRHVTSSFEILLESERIDESELLWYIQKIAPLPISIRASGI
jgi:hypothetical protein